MAKNEKLTRRAFGPISSGAAILLLMGGAAISIMGPASLAAVDAYLKIPGIDGESTDAAHRNWIVVSSVTSGDLKSEAAVENTQTIGSPSSGSGAGKVTMGSMKEPVQPRDAATGMASGKRMHQPFVIMKEVDKASPKLMEAASSGKHFTEVDVDMGGNHYQLYDVMLSVRKAGGQPMEALTFTYQKIEMK